MLKKTMQERADEWELVRPVDSEAEERLRQLILYLASRCEGDPAFGATKLNKLLYFADFSSYRQYGKPITGVPYMKLPEGPAPVYLVKVRNEMIQAGDIVLKDALFYRYPQKRIVAIKNPNLSVFNARDIALIEWVIRSLRGHTAREVSDLSHGRAWRIAGDKEHIPYEASLLMEGDPTEADAIEAQMLVQKYGWTDV
ncbi:MAG TPA: Panacea domain-containing protein [Blastocatellia bacterium]|nr:Panacea domain-containing protein [Blastocatellia bacterium]